MNISLLFFLITFFLIPNDNIFDKSYTLLDKVNNAYRTNTALQLETDLIETNNNLSALLVFGKFNSEKNLYIDAAQFERLNSSLSTYYNDQNEEKFKIYLRTNPQNNFLAIHAYLSDWAKKTTYFDSKRDKFLKIGYLIAKDHVDKQTTILTKNSVSGYTDLLAKQQTINTKYRLLHWWNRANNSFMTIGGLISSYVFSQYLKYNSFLFIPNNVRFGGLVFSTLLGFSLLLKSRVKIDEKEILAIQKDVNKYNKLSILAEHSDQFRKIFYPLAYMWKIADLTLGDDKTENRNLFVTKAKELAATLD